MKNYFEISVSYKGKHLFTTRDIETKKQYDKVIKVFKAKFPEYQGFEISSAYVEVIPQGIEVM
jgi:hypothetical protein